MECKLATVLFFVLLITARAQECDSTDGILKVVDKKADVTIVEYVFDEKGSEYIPERTIKYKQPITSQYQDLAVDVMMADGAKKGQVCVGTRTYGDGCGRTDCSPAPMIWGSLGSCFQLYRRGLYRVSNERKDTYNNAQCNFDGISRTSIMEKAGKDLINMTYVEDRETSKCGEPARRYLRTETLMYKLTDGCLLNAKAQGCDLGPVGSNPCKKCGPGEARAWVTMSNLEGSCLAESRTCDMEAAGFRGCPQGHQASSIKGTKLTCTLCKPHTYNGNSADESGSGLRVKCLPCGDYQEAPLWGSESCRGCPNGQVPTRKRAPLNCKPCPPGSYASGIKCVKCAEGFYQSKAGQMECKKCPTEWRCLVPNKVLGKFGTTPYRWDESGNPACASLDGKTCWKADPDTCAGKLKQLPGLIAQKKLKALICGPYHVKVWGNDGYGDYNGWCQITKRLLLRPGKPEVGATGCTADAKMVGPLPTELLGLDAEGNTCKCPSLAP